MFILQQKDDLGTIISHRANKCRPNNTLCSRNLVLVLDWRRVSNEVVKSIIGQMWSNVVQGMHSIELIRRGAYYERVTHTGAMLGNR